MLLADAAGTAFHARMRPGRGCLPTIAAGTDRATWSSPSKVRTLWELCDAAFVTTWSEVAEGTFFRGL